MAAITNTVKQHIASCLGEEVSSYKALSGDGCIDEGRKGSGGEVYKQVGHAVAVVKEDSRTFPSSPNLCGQSDINSKEMWVRDV